MLYLGGAMLAYSLWGLEGIWVGVLLAAAIYNMREKNLARSGR